MKLVLKWLINGVIAVSLLMFFSDATFWEAAIASTALTLIAYYVGDQLILRASNNTVATISDAVLSFVILWIASYEMNWGLGFGGLILIAVLLAVAEWLIHRFLLGGRQFVRAS